LKWIPYKTGNISCGLTITGKHSFSLCDRDKYI